MELIGLNCGSKKGANRGQFWQGTHKPLDVSSNLTLATLFAPTYAVRKTKQPPYVLLSRPAEMLWR